MRLIAFGLSLLVLGCTTNTLEKRKAEKITACQALDPEARTQVDEGIIRDGMSEDAVYVAWGKPSEVIAIETPTGPLTKWLYKGTYYQEQSQWVFKPETTRLDYYGRPEGAIRSRRLEKSFEPHYYVKAEVDL